MKGLTLKHIMDTFRTTAENTDFEWHELESRYQPHIKDAIPGMIFNCLELDRILIREESCFIIKPKTYLGTGTIRGSVEFVEALIGNKFCLVTYSLIE